MSYPFEVPVPRPEEGEPKTNYISTTKYNLLTFLPFALILQFRRYANIYFLIVAILQSIPIVSPLNPASAIAPLVFVVGLSMTREGVEDYRRWRSDQKDNAQLTSLYTFKFQDQEWRNLRAGDFVQIDREKVIPADILVLISSAPSGISYVETSSLDGQKNLKPKFSSAPLQKAYNHQKTLPNFNDFRGQVRCIEPTAEIEKFQGEMNLQLNNLTARDRINKKNMILRGCKLKNTDWVIGMVIYTGEDTAIMKNSSEPFTKTSNIEAMVNKMILVIFAFELLCSMGTGIFGLFQCRSNYEFVVTITQNADTDCARLMAISFGSYFVLYSTFIPISLIVSLEFVKVFQGYFMVKDKEMYCRINKKRMACRTVSINEQLGQIEYILTDKTGTLTCNKMEFKNVVVGKEMYGEEIKIMPVGNIDYEALMKRGSTSKQSKDGLFNSRGISYDLSGNSRQSGDMKTSQRQLIELMFTMIATCHQCIPNDKGQFQGPSPDQVALLKAAYQVGFKFISNQNKIMTVQYNESNKVFELLKLIEFDSDRKRMTVVLRAEQSLIVFTKGADTSIEKILAPKQFFIEQIRTKTTQMTRTGLRSLWFSYKTLPLQTDVNSLTEKDLESDQTLIGATGIEDKLQDYVPETIYSLREGGLKVVMLTGDKLETAENIALACKMIEEGYLIRGVPDLSNFVRIIETHELSQFPLNSSPVIDGSTLSFVENQEDLSYVIEKSKSVVFCRVTPGQKAEIVKFVKDMGKLTLAVGDGANDVNMIMEANVGIGIFGQEGTRAAQVANYAIGEFCLLWKLLLFHGRLNYIRITEMILYFFYKNMVFTTVQFVYAFYSMGSGMSFWLSWSITFYNMIFTLFPVVIRAVLEVDVQITPNKKTFHQLSQGTHEQQTLYSYYPRMYFISQKNKLFSKMIFFAWFFLGTFQGAICIILTIYAIGDENDTSGSDSLKVGLYLVQISVYTSVIIVVTIKIAVNIKQWTVLMIIGISVPSIGLYIVWTFIQGFFQKQVTVDSIIDLLKTPGFYFVQILCVGGLFCLDFFLFSLKSTKQSFDNYLKTQTLKKRRLSEANLKEYMIEMYEARDRTISL